MRYAMPVRPGGVVDFDPDVSETDRDLMIAELVKMGHTLEFHDGPHPQHGGASHVILLTGPHSPAGVEKMRADAAKA